VTDNFEVSIDPRDLAEFYICMENLDPDKVLAEEWRGFLVPLQRELRTYPPRLPNQKYIRTFNLKRNWQYTVYSPRHAELNNLAAYAGWVEGVEQAAVHQGRWPIAVEVADTRLEEWISRLADKFGRIWTK
jgi:hypothetical protein